MLITKVTRENIFTNYRIAFFSPLNNKQIYKQETFSEFTKRRDVIF